MRFHLVLSEGERRAMVELLIEGSPDEPLKLSPSPLSSGSRGVTPLLTSARFGTFGVLSELRIEVHLDMLAKMSLRGGKHGSNSLWASDPFFGDHRRL